MEKNKVGRPSMGITKKVSITLPKEIWDFLDEYQEQQEVTQSAMFREMTLDKVNEIKVDQVSVDVIQFPGSKLHIYDFVKRTKCGLKAPIQPIRMSLEDYKRENGCKNCLRLL